MKPFGKTSRGSSINDIRKKTINLLTLFPHVYNRPNWGYLLPVPTVDSGHPNFNLITHPPSSNYPPSLYISLRGNFLFHRNLICILLISSERLGVL